MAWEWFSTPEKRLVDHIKKHYNIPKPVNNTDYLIFFDAEICWIRNITINEIVEDIIKWITYVRRQPLKTKVKEKRIELLIYNLLYIDCLNLGEVNWESIKNDILEKQKYIKILENTAFRREDYVEFIYCNHFEEFINFFRTNIDQKWKTPLISFENKKEVKNYFSNIKTSKEFQKYQKEIFNKINIVEVIKNQ